MPLGPLTRRAAETALMGRRASIAASVAAASGFGALALPGAAAAPGEGPRGWRERG
jgi:hypothetical protein